MQHAFLKEFLPLFAYDAVACRFLRVAGAHGDTDNGKCVLMDKFWHGGFSNQQNCKRNEINETMPASILDCLPASKLRLIIPAPCGETGGRKKGGPRGPQQKEAAEA